jgi:hypothetical protein
VPLPLFTGSHSSLPAGAPADADGRTDETDGSGRILYSYGPIPDVEQAIEVAVTDTFRDL